MFLFTVSYNCIPSFCILLILRFILSEREAMWIAFTADHPFAIKVHVGGVNAVSGNLATAKADENNSPVQDYVVTPDQLWLDGIAAQDGKVLQFVATPAGSKYSVESQISGKSSNDICPKGV